MSKKRRVAITVVALVVIAATLWFAVLRDNDGGP
jgi:hypothetical protein